MEGMRVVHELSASACRGQITLLLKISLGIKEKSRQRLKRMCHKYRKSFSFVS